MKQIKKTLEKILIGQSIAIEKINPNLRTIYPPKDQNYNPNSCDSQNMWFKYIHSHFRK